MSNSSGNLQSEIQLREAEINKLNKKIQQLEKDLLKERQLKDDEIDGRASDKKTFEKKILELEE